MLFSCAFDYSVCLLHFYFYYFVFIVFLNNMAIIASLIILLYEIMDMMVQFVFQLPYGYIQSIMCLIYDADFQWWILTKYIYSSTVLKYKFEVLLVLKYFHFMQLYTFTSLHLRGKCCSSTTFVWQLKLLFKLLTCFLFSENLVSPNLVILNVSDKLKDEVFLYVLRKISYFFK